MKQPYIVLVYPPNTAIVSGGIIPGLAIQTPLQCLVRNSESREEAGQLVAEEAKKQNVQVNCITYGPYQGISFDEIKKQSNDQELKLITAIDPKLATVGYLGFLIDDPSSVLSEKDKQVIKTIKQKYE